jgi:hypothetical protein
VCGADIVAVASDEPTPYYVLSEVLLSGVSRVSMGKPSVAVLFKRAVSDHIGFVGGGVTTDSVHIVSLKDADAAQVASCVVTVRRGAVSAQLWF